MVELNFLLNIEDGWPPATHECLPCIHTDIGYKIVDAPFFIKDLSVGDIISVNLNKDDEVISWNRIDKSGRTTIWLLRLSSDYTDEIKSVLAELRSKKCNTGELSQFGIYTIDVPENFNIQDVDKCLEKLDSSKISIAYPSFRHQEPAA